MNPTGQIACCAHRKVIYERMDHEGGTCSDSWKCADCGIKFVPEPFIKSAIKKVTEEHQVEHDRLQSIIEKDTLELLAEKEKSRVLGNMVDGLRAAHASDKVDGGKRLDCGTFMPPAHASEHPSKVAGIKVRWHQSDDTKRLDWLEVLTDVKWSTICKLSKPKWSLRQTIDAAMSQTKE